MAAGGGEWVADFDHPEPVPAPITTIAWRLAHLIVGVFGERNASHFGGPAMSYQTVDWPSTAAGALALLDDGYRRWVAGVAALGDEGPRPADRTGRRPVGRRALQRADPPHPS